MPIPDRNHFVSAYTGKAPWDIGRPQKIIVEAAERVTGSVLDAGCGTGENSLFLAARGQAVTGIDFLEEPIRRARQKASQRGVPATFLVKDALMLKDWEERFDTVIDSGLFHVFGDADRLRYVEGLAAVMKPAGKLILVCFSDQEPGDRGPRRVSKKELLESFREGWQIDSIAPVRFQVIPEMDGSVFSSGGPKAWLLEARRIW